MKFELVEMLEGQLEQSLGRTRFIHTRGVAYTSAALAMKWYKYEIDRVMIAGYMHDCAKNKSVEELLSKGADYMIFPTDFQIKHPQLLHAICGPAIAQEDYGIFDREIHDAIRTHTTGAPNMTIMQKIVYVADFIEPTREIYDPNIEEYREMAFTDLDKAVYMIANRTIEYLTSKGVEFDPLTTATRDFYKELVEKNDK